MIVSIPKSYQIPATVPSDHPFIAAHDTLKRVVPDSSFFYAIPTTTTAGTSSSPIQVTPIGAGDRAVSLEMRRHVLELLFREIDAQVERGQKNVCMNLARNLEIGIYFYCQGREKSYKKKTYFIACMMRRAGKYILTHVDSLWKIVSVEPSKIVFSWNVKRGRMSRDGDGRVLTGGTLATMNVFSEMEDSIKRIYSRTVEESGHGAKKEEFKCAKCGFNKYVGYRYQNRSGDEGMAYYLICLGCGVKTSVKR